jgi:hypothetical protein
MKTKFQNFYSLAKNESVNFEKQLFIMNKLIFTFCLLSFSCFLSAQTGNKLPDLDKSSMDMSYYPANYPILKIQNKTTEPPVARVVYSRPLRQGRKVFGELVEYGKLWRLGANEATEIEFFKDVRISGKKIQKGRYTLYALVNENNWTLIINKDTDVWGAFKYESKKDVLRIELPVEKTAETIEAFSIVFEKSNNIINLVIAWENVRVSLPIIK